MSKRTVKMLISTLIIWAAATSSELWSTSSAAATRVTAHELALAGPP